MGFNDPGGGFIPSVCLLLVVSGVLWGAWGFPLHLLAVVPPELAHQVKRTLRKSVSDIDRIPGQDVALSARVLSLGNGTQDVITTLCNYSLSTPIPSLLFTFLDPVRTYYVSLVTGYVRIPHLGFRSGYLDTSSKDANLLYLSLDPTAEDLADATYQFLCDNEWYHIALLTDSSQSSSTIFRRLNKLIRYKPWTKPQRILVDTSDNTSEIFQLITNVHRSKTRVFILHCDTPVLRMVLKEAEKLNMLEGEWIWIILDSSPSENDHLSVSNLPIGLLSLRPRFHPHNRYTIRSLVKLVAKVAISTNWSLWSEDYKNLTVKPSCSFESSDSRKKLSSYLYSMIKSTMEDARMGLSTGTRYGKQLWPTPVIDILNLVPETNGQSYWKVIGNITGSEVHIDSVMWLGNSRTGPSPTGRQRFRTVTGYAPPFVMPATKVLNGSCLVGVNCLQVSTNDKDELLEIFADYASGKSEGITYNVTCCSGISIDLLVSVARDLKFDYDLYLVADGVFGTNKSNKWNGITADIISGAAHLTFAAFSATSQRSKFIDFSVPYFHSGVSCLTYSQLREVPLSAFLIPFSYPLWMAIFASLNVTAIFAAIYEWHSPFGLNPWGRQRTKNFSVASALWVMWSLLFSHLVAFKAPKSWPNKVLINLWGCFSVIFVSSYTANIAALFAGLFFRLRVDDFHDASLLNQRTGTAKSSAAEGYVHDRNMELWQHIQNHGVANLVDGLEKLRKSELDVLIGDTAVLNYFRGNDPICGLHLLGESVFDDAYAIGMQKGFPLKADISKLILRYNEYGYLDQLQKKWYGRVPCFTDYAHGLNKPKPLGVRAVAGVFIMLGVGHLVGILILFLEHLVFKYALPILRSKPNECIWRSLNLMFFSQKLYRFINTVELVSPHHSAKEIVSNLREGQIASLFQKSVKRKAKEEARRRKSKSQFFEMIQEIRKVVRQQQSERRIASNRLNQQPHTTIQTVNTEPKTLNNRETLTVHYNDTLPRHNNQPLLNKPFSFTRPIVADAYKSKIISSYSLQYDDILTPPSSSITSNDSSPSGWTHGISFSLEDINTANGTEAEQINPMRKRSRVSSLEDLRVLKKTCAAAEFSNERRSVATTSSDRRKQPLLQRSKEINELRLYSMTKEEILSLWQASERVLLNRLREVLKEKKMLEEKLAFIQKTLLKPP